MNGTILIIDDEAGMCASLAELLEASGFASLHSTDPTQTLSLLRQNSIDLLIVDLRMPEIGGIELLKMVKEEFDSLPVIMISGFSTVESAVTAMRYGAVNFFSKPLPIDDVLKEIRTILSSRQIPGTGRQRKRHPDLSSNNREMGEIISILEKVAPTNASVIVTGESGTGKELVANYLHRNSTRKDNAFVKVNCAAIPGSLMESELFGHEKGAFTDAKTMRKGKFELADGGSLFLDEIGDMDINTQAKILRVLQEQEFQRLGGHELLKSDVRFIAATNKNIPELIQNGQFREDLYYRLSVIEIKLPPLKRRTEDIGDLIHYFLDEFNRIYNKSIQGISPSVEMVLYSHNWPGNIRELKNCMERAVIFCEGDRISMKDLPEQYKDIPSISTQSEDYFEARDQLDKELILKALSESDGIKHKAAEKLKMHRKTLYNKMKKLGLE